MTIDQFTTASGTVALGNISPFVSGGEFGLTLEVNEAASTNNAQATVTWRYTVSSDVGIDDALLQVAGTTQTGGGKNLIDEDLSNAISLPTLENVTGTGMSAISFAPALNLTATKTASVSEVGAGGATLGSITNAFSPVPGPIVGAGLPGVLAALGGLVAMARRRRKQLAEVSASRDAVADLASAYFFACALLVSLASFGS